MKTKQRNIRDVACSELAILNDKRAQLCWKHNAQIGPQPKVKDSEVCQGRKVKFARKHYFTPLERRREVTDERDVCVELRHRVEHGEVDGVVVCALGGIVAGVIDDDVDFELLKTHQRGMADDVERLFSDVQNNLVRATGSRTSGSTSCAVMVMAESD